MTYTKYGCIYVICCQMMMTYCRLRISRSPYKIRLHLCNVLSRVTSTYMYLLYTFFWGKKAGIHENEVIRYYAFR